MTVPREPTAAEWALLERIQRQESALKALEERGRLLEGSLGGETTVRIRAVGYDQAVEQP